MAARWHPIGALSVREYRCGFCDLHVASEKGYALQELDVHGKPKSKPEATIYLCPKCRKPTFFTIKGEQYPGVRPGAAVLSLPDDIERLYQEARSSLAAAAPTSAVLTLRKLLMNIAVNLGAPKNQNFMEYVEYLSDKGYVPPNGKGWVDHIRRKGNEANHEIRLMDPADGLELIAFAEMLLKFIYEFPNRVPKAADPAAP